MDTVDTGRFGVRSAVERGKLTTEAADAALASIDFTDDATSLHVVALARSAGKNPVVVQDAPLAWGYVANRVYGAMIREAERVARRGRRHPRGDRPADGRLLPLAGRPLRDGAWCDLGLVVAAPA